MYIYTGHLYTKTYTQSSFLASERRQRVIQIRAFIALQGAQVAAAMLPQLYTRLCKLGELENKRKPLVLLFYSKQFSYNWVAHICIANYFFSIQRVLWTHIMTCYIFLANSVLRFFGRARMKFFSSYYVNVILFSTVQSY